jgi:hypothetical protein
MGSQNWTLQKIDLSANTFSNMINTETIIYTKAKDILNKIEVITATIPKQDITYKIPKQELTIGHLIYMNKGEHKIICEWGNTNYLVLVSQSII